MKLISWNVNGLRACLTHGFAESFAALDADIFSVQETKMQPGQADFAPEGYTEYTYSAEKKGYSGTACWCRKEPLQVTMGIGAESHDHEGRVLTLEYPDFYLVNCYTPNSQDGLKRLDYRMEWEDAFRAYLLALDAKKPVILCGDLNVAHTEMDIKNARTNRMSAGFTDQERAKMTELLAAGFADSRFTPIAVSTCITTISRISVDTLESTNFGASDSIGALLLNTNLRLVKYAKMTPAVQLITLNTTF